MGQSLSIPIHIKDFIEIDETSPTRLRWKRTPKGSTVNKGDPAGFLFSGKYMRVGFFGKRYFAHRVIFFLQTGHQPPNDLAYCNYYDASNYTEGGRGKAILDSIKQKKESGYMGVTEVDGQWEARFGHRFVGVYDDKDRAALEYNRAALDYDPEFAYLNRIPDAFFRRFYKPVRFTPASQSRSA